MRSLAPAWATPLIAGLERLVSPSVHRFAMFAHIVLERTAAPA